MRSDSTYISLLQKIIENNNAEASVMSATQVCEPMKPAPPVTRICFIFPSQLQNRSGAWILSSEGNELVRTWLWQGVSAMNHQPNWDADMPLRDTLSNTWNHIQGHTYSPQIKKSQLPDCGDWLAGTFLHGLPDPITARSRAARRIRGICGDPSRSACCICSGHACSARGACAI